MKKLNKTFLVLTTALFVWIGLTATAFGQAKTIIKEEFNREIKKAFEISETTFPRRETESKPSKRQMFEENQDEPSEIILNEKNIREFLTKDKIRYEFEKETTKGKTLIKRMQIGSNCYEADGEKWKKIQIACDLIIYTATGGADKENFLFENGTIDTKPVKIFRNVKIGRVYSDGESPYLNEYLYYLDSAGRVVKYEHLTRRGEEKSKLENSTTYEFDVKTAPINPPSAQKKTKKRR